MTILEYFTSFLSMRALRRQRWVILLVLGLTWRPTAGQAATCQSTYGTAGAQVDTDASLCGTLVPYASTTTSGSTACGSPVGGGTITVASTANFAAAGAGTICNNANQCTPFLYTSKDASNFLGVTNGTQGQIPACVSAYPSGSRVYAKDTANIADTRWNVVKSAVQAAQTYDGPVLAGNQLPAAGTVGQKAVVTGTNGTSCTSTGGSVVLKCVDNGSAWVPFFTGSTSAELATLLSDENGSGGGFVRATSPTLTTPTLGVAAATTINADTSLNTIGAQGQVLSRGHCMELVNINSTGTNVFTTTLTTGCFIPADATVLSVPVRVVTAVGGTPTMTVSATTSGTFFQKGTSINTTAGITDPGNKPGPAPYNGVAAQSITLTLSANPGDTAGQVRVDIFYETSTPATS